MAEPGARYEKTFEVRATDLDVNRHLTSSAYLDDAIHARMSSLADLGLLEVLAAERLAPVVFRDEIDYRRELRALDRVSVSVELAGLSQDGSRWRLHHEFTRADGVHSARIRTDGAWFHLKTRKLTVPPPAFARDFAALHHTDDFEVLPNPAAPGETSG
jgi:acyl-CoA thioester hydrolase